MPTFRCDLDVTGDLVLPPQYGVLNTQSSAGYSFAFTNVPAGADGHVNSLNATVVGPSESIETARDDLQRALADQLNLLTFVTHSRFKIIAPRRLMEWEPGAKQRTLKVFHTADLRHPPDPELDPLFLKTCEALDRACTASHIRTALKYFRYGLLDAQPEDQFMHLWLALEIMAENGKDPDPVAIVCTVCGVNMTCHACGDSPTRVPMAKQAINSLIGMLAGSDASVVSKRQFKARNGLMHGRSRDSIEAECRVSLPFLVDELGTLTWHAIMSAIRLPPETELILGHRDGQFANISVVASINMLIEHAGDDPNPLEDQIPNAQITLTTTFKSPSASTS